MTDRKVGIIGLGIMGGAIARNLVERGWEVVGFDTDPSRRNALALAGVTIADGARAVASNVSMIITSLPNADAANAVATEIAASGQPARIVIETSTLTIADKQHFKAFSSPQVISRSTVRSAEPARRPRSATSSSMRAETRPRSRDVPACLPTLPSRAPISATMATAAG